ncbi:hypothetical protein PPACK8108_LOCUS1089 [Phakopsora pachyrhizi]|uniref:Phospholipid/glycerol acyltransferase domain-containing protein n=1 Tax=Phakopsora pachyrhizi TaxID=170000 RepID=A0A0S1MKB1_PHAPC|nr:hypothetical protein PPACK8108_LOCUS1089 [Phakopsora pachyrhizi]
MAIHTKSEGRATRGSAIRLSLYLISYAAFTIIANLLFLITSLVIMPFDVLKAYEINSRIAHTLWYYMQYVFEYSHGAAITFSGDVLPAGENAIVMANHLSYSDFYLINGLAARKGMLPYCRWFVKSSLMWQLPIFGLSMYLIGMVMVARDWLRDSESIKRAFKVLKTPIGKGKKVWLISFLEGTRLTDEKSIQCQLFCQENKKKVLKNVLSPRTKGFIAAIRELRDSQITHIYDFTLAYEGPKGFGKPPNLAEIHWYDQLSPDHKFHVHVRRWSISSLPETESELRDWVEKVWEEKDEILEGMRNYWVNHRGLVGFGSQPNGRSGASGVYYDQLWEDTSQRTLKID